MAKKYVDISIDDFNMLMHEMKFEQEPIQKANYEISYRRFSRNNKYMIRIYSTITQECGTSRDKGRDMIRIILYAVVDGAIKRIFQAVDTQRTTNWRQIIRGKLSLIFDSWADANIHPCEKCGGLMVMRRAYTGKMFYGCLSFPSCENIKSSGYYYK